MKIFDFQFCVLFIKLYIYKIANQIFKTFVTFVVFSICQNWSRIKLKRSITFGIKFSALSKTSFEKNQLHIATPAALLLWFRHEGSAKRIFKLDF